MGNMKIHNFTSIRVICMWSTKVSCFPPTFFQILNVTAVEKINYRFIIPIKI